MEGMLEAGLCVAAGVISLIVAITVALMASERRFRWRLLAIVSVFGVADGVAGFVAPSLGVDDDAIYWFSVPFFLLMFVSLGGLVGALIGWGLRFGVDHIR